MKKDQIRKETVFQKDLKERIKGYMDFPKPGVDFKDMQSIISDPFLAKGTAKALNSLLPKEGLLFAFNKVLCLDARGFIFGTSISLFAGKPMIMARKPGKLPGDLIVQSFKKEYGAIEELTVQKGLIIPGDKVLIHDDLLATGGTTEAAAKIVLGCRAEIAGFNFVMEVDSLKGRELLLNYVPDEKINSLVIFD